MSNDVINTLVESLKPGDKLGYFNVIEQIAAGGMGVVWKGMDPVMNRHVAIKQLAVQLSDDEKFRDRFRKEAQIQKQVTEGHPYLVQIIDFIEDSRGYFIVMEFIQGTTLERVLSRATEPVDVLQTLGIIRDVATALQAMHDAGVIHRDLKPSNILIGANRVVKVCDFGLATMLAEQDTLEMGSARYMAPESFTGQPVDARADLYALGMIAYEMLLGRPKFNEQFKAVTRDHRNEPMRWMKWHSNLKLQAPPLQTINEFVPEMLDELIHRLMAKDVSQRIPSGAAAVEIITRNFSKNAPATQPTAPISGHVATPPPPPPPAPTMGAGTQTQPANASAPANQAVVTSSPVPPVVATHQPEGEPAGTIPADPPGMETAALPKRGKALIFSAVFLILILIGVGIFFAVDEYEKQQVIQALLDQASDEYDAAKKLMEDNNFAASKLAFQELAKKWESKNHQQFFHASNVRSILCQARIDIADANEQLTNQDYESALATYQQVSDALEQASDTNANKLNHNMTGEISELDTINSKRMNFIENILPLKKLITAGDNEQARIKMRILDRSRELYTDDEKKILAIIRQENENTAVQGEINDVIANSNDLVQSNKLTEALTQLREGFEKFPSSTLLRDRISLVEKKLRYENAISAAKSAEQSGDLAAAITAYGQAQLIETKPQVATHINSLKASILNAEARQLQLSGNKQAAMQKYVESLGYAKTPEAENGVKNIKQSDRRNAMVAQGTSAMNAGQFEQAIQHFKSALSMGPDTQGNRTELMLKVSRVRLTTNKAKQLLNEGKLIDAGKAIDEALSIDPQDKIALQLADDVLLAAKYNLIVKQADEMRKKLKYRHSGRAYREAKKLIAGSSISPEEIDQRIRDNEYENYIFKTKEDIEIRNWISAKANYAVLKKYNTKEVQEIGKYIEEHAPK